MTSELSGLIVSTLFLRSPNLKLSAQFVETVEENKTSKFDIRRQLFEKNPFIYVIKHCSLLDPKTKFTFKYALSIHRLHERQGGNVNEIVIIWVIVSSYTVHTVLPSSGFLPGLRGQLISVTYLRRKAQSSQ